jgi:hypothetical protein
MQQLAQFNQVNHKEPHSDHSEILVILEIRKKSRSDGKPST